MIDKIRLLNPKTFFVLIKYSSEYRRNLAIIVVVNLILSSSGVATALLIKNVIDFAIEGLIQNAIMYGIALVMLFLGNLILSSFTLVYTAKVRETMTNSIQMDFLNNVYSKKWTPLQNYKAGDILTRANDDTSGIVETWVYVFPNIISLVVQLLIAYVVLAEYDRLLALFAFIISPATIIPSLIIGRKLKRIQHQIQHSESILNSFINESIHNLIIIKAFNIKRDNLKYVNDYQLERQKHILRKNRISACANFLLSLGYQIGFISAFAFGVYRIAEEVITFGTFTAFLQLVAMIQGPIHGLSRTIPQMITSLASVERIEELKDLPDEEIEVEVQSKKRKDPTMIIVDDLYFEYNKSMPVLNGLSLQITKGEKIALVGNSGEGKTTFAKVLLGLASPQSGSIEMTLSDGAVIPVSSATRKHFSYVPQNNDLFSGTIEYNVKLANPNATEEEVHKALIASYASSFITSLPKGLNTLVGENGIGLSEGQIQRICIARALLHKTPFLILDEATSALDIESEDAIIQGMLTYYPELTVIAITHRQAILKVCDSVYTLYKGKLSRLESCHLT